MSWWSRRRRDEADRQLDLELRDHLERLAADYVAAGMAPDDAQRKARLVFGGVGHVKEDCRAVRRWRAFDEIRQDLRYAIRTLVRAPGFTTASVLTLALGIGMNTAVFSMLEAVLLQPLPYPDPDRLLWVTTYEPTWNEEFVEPGDFDAWHAESSSFDGIAAYETRDATIRTEAGVVRARIALVSSDFWPVTGATPAIGALPREGERELIVSHAFFERWLRADPAAIGRSIVVGQDPVHVSGVLPRTALSLQSFLPRSLSSTLDAGAIAGYASTGEFSVLDGVIAKLAPGVPAAAGSAELDVIRARRIAATPEGWQDGNELRVTPLRDEIVDQARRPLWILMAAVLFVLLIACANVATMCLARASTRRREFAVRTTLGAGRARLLRQVLAESVLLALVGGVAGVVIAYWGLALLAWWIPGAVPRLLEASIAGRVLLFSVFAATTSGLLFGIAPALSLGTPDGHGLLRDGFKTTTAPGGIRTRRLLVAVEVALAVVLLVGAALMVKSAWLMHRYPPGFEPDRILTMKVPLSGPRYFGDLARQRAYLDEALRRLNASEDVAAASLVYRGPAQPGIRWEGAPAASDEGGPTTVPTQASADYARVMGLSLIAGRWFTDREPEPVIVINQALARRDFGDRDPIGARLEGVGVVIGVVADLKVSALDVAPEPEFFAPVFRPDLRRLDGATILVRTRREAGGLAPAMQSLVSSVDPAEPVYDVKTLEQVLADSIAPRRFVLLLLGAFAVVALSVALVGIYGVTAYAAAQRAHEIGVRMTLGAMRADIVRLVLRQGLAMASAGLGAGLAAAAGLSRVMENLLYEVEPTDAGTFGAVGIAFAMTALAACWLPALRAARADPVEAMRHE